MRHKIGLLTGGPSSLGCGSIKEDCSESPDCAAIKEGCFKRPEGPAVNRPDREVGTEAHRNSSAEGAALTGNAFQPGTRVQFKY